MTWLILLRLRSLILEHFLLLLSLGLRLVGLVLCLILRLFGLLSLSQVIRSLLLGVLGSIGSILRLRRSSCCCVLSTLGLSENRQVVQRSDSLVRLEGKRSRDAKRQDHDHLHRSLSPM